MVVVESKINESQYMGQQAPEQASPEELAPPGTRVLPQSFRKDGTRYRPGERLEKQARKWATKNDGGSPRAPPHKTTWNRADARDTLTRLMAELAIE
jgi:hypothetical protein